MYIKTIEDVITNKTGKGKAIIIIDPRQVGKKTLIKSLLEKVQHLFLDADDPTVRSLLDKPNTEQLRNIK